MRVERVSARPPNQLEEAIEKSKSTRSFARNAHA